MQHFASLNTQKISGELTKLLIFAFKQFTQHKTKGAIVRSRARWYEHGERNSKYFMNLEKRAYERKHIIKLKTNENQYLEEG